MWELISSLCIFLSLLVAIRLREAIWWFPHRDPELTFITVVGAPQQSAVPGRKPEPRKTGRRPLAGTHGHSAPIPSMVWALQHWPWNRQLRWCVSCCARSLLRCYSKEPCVNQVSASRGKRTLEIISHVIQVPQKDIQGLTLQECSPQMLLLLDQVAWRIFAVREWAEDKLQFNLWRTPVQEIISFIYLAST